MKKQNERGAVSVLVVVTMLLLMTFGLLALTSALAFDRLGTKTENWSEDVYKLDSAAEETLQNVDICLYKAEIKARETVQETVKGAAPESIAAQYAIHGWGSGYTYSPEYFDRLYFYFAVTELQAELVKDNTVSVKLNTDKYATANDILSDKNIADGDVVISFNASEGIEANSKNLTVELSVLPSGTELRLISRTLSGGRTGRLMRYRIRKWQQWQPYQEMEDPSFGQIIIPDENMDDQNQNTEDLPFEVDDTLPKD